MSFVWIGKIKQWKVLTPRVKLNFCFPPDLTNSSHRHNSLQLDKLHFKLEVINSIFFYGALNLVIKSLSYLMVISWICCSYFSNGQILWFSERKRQTRQALNELRRNNTWYPTIMESWMRTKYPHRYWFKES